MAYRKLGRLSHQRKAMLRDLSTDLIINERIVTTEARAKELRSVVEKLITLGKRGDFMLVVKQLHMYVQKSLTMKLEQLQFKNYSLISHLVTLSVMVDTLVS